MEAEAAAALFKQHLAYTDRRSLSQAWYSALHLADRDRAAPFARIIRRELPPAAALGASRGVSAPSSEVLAKSTRQRTARPEVPRHLPDRNSPADRLRRSTFSANVPARRPAHPAGTALTMTFGGARVHLLLRRAGESLSVVALCAQRQAGGVRAALGEAQRALIACGEDVRCSVVALESLR